MRMLRILTLAAAVALLLTAPSTPREGGAPRPVATLEGAGTWECYACLVGALGLSFSSPSLSGYFAAGCAAACTMTL